MSSDDLQGLREHLAASVRGHGAHISFSQAVANFPPERVGETVPNLAHSAWDLVYHMDLVLRDLIDWVEAEHYQAHEYPGGYWPPEHGPPDTETWHRTVARVEESIDRIASWIEDDAHDLFAPLERDARHDRFRQALLAVDHNSYHIGQLVDLRMLLGIPVRDW